MKLSVKKFVGQNKEIVNYYETCLAKKVLITKLNGQIRK